MRRVTQGMWLIGTSGLTLAAAGCCLCPLDHGANHQFMQRIGGTSITVFPACVREGDGQSYNNAAAGRIAKFLSRADVAGATLSEARVPVTGQWRTPWHKMVRQSAKALGRYVRAHPMDTPYALLPVYWMSGSGVAKGVRAYVVDARGRLAWAVIETVRPHRRLFDEASPKTVDDCTAVVIEMLDRSIEKSVKRGRRLEAIRQKGADASLTVFPPVVGDRPIKEAADVVALMLEKAGMESLETTETAFQMPEGIEFDEAAGAFGEFVRDHPIATDYALYGQFVGTPQTGPQEVRGIVVDKAGRGVWVDRQMPDDDDFKRIKPDCPMTCCVLLTERLRGALKLPKSAKKDDGEGKFAKRMAQKSGTPKKAERAAMEARLEAMKKAGRRTSVAVFPVRLSDDEVSSQGAAHLAELLNRKGLCQAQTVDTALHIELQRSRDEQKVLWDMAHAFREHIKRNPPAADYAVYADYMFSGRDGRVMAVHLAVCDRAGEWVIVDFQNSHWGDFKSIDPQTSEDCGRLAARRLAGYLR